MLVRMLVARVRVELLLVDWWTGAVAIVDVVLELAL